MGILFIFFKIILICVSPFPVKLLCPLCNFELSIISNDKSFKFFDNPEKKIEEVPINASVEDKGPKINEGKGSN